jgi:hypothetical protein
MVFLKALKRQLLWRLLLLLPGAADGLRVLQGPPSCGLPDAV